MLPELKRSCSETETIILLMLTLADRYRFWTGLLLIVRLIVTTVFSYTTDAVPQVNNYIITLVVGILLYKSGSVYRDKRLNALESFYLFNLCLLALLNVLSDHMELGITSTVTAVSISLSLVAQY